MRRRVRDPRWISVTEAARMIGVTPGYVRTLVDSRRLQAKRRVLRVRLLYREAVQRFARRRALQHTERDFRQPFRPRTRGQDETLPEQDAAV